MRALRRGDELAVTVAELGGEGGKVKSGCLECFESIRIDPIERPVRRKVTELGEGEYNKC